MNVNDTRPITFSERIALLEKQLLRVWGALSPGERKKIFLLKKFSLLRDRVVAFKEQAAIKSKGTVDL